MEYFYITELTFLMLVLSQRCIAQSAKCIPGSTLHTRADGMLNYMGKKENDMRFHLMISILAASEHEPGYEI